jgi:hypothetical protein
MSRALSASQLAVVAARRWPRYEAENRKKQQAGVSADGTAGGRGRKKKPLAQSVPEVNGDQTRTRKELARKFRVGENAIQQARLLLEKAPDLVEQIEQGATTVPAATETYKERDRKAKELEDKMDRLGKYREAVERGEGGERSKTPGPLAKGPGSRSDGPDQVLPPDRPAAPVRLSLFGQRSTKPDPLGTDRAVVRDARCRAGLPVTLQIGCRPRFA